MSIKSYNFWMGEVYCGAVTHLRHYDGDTAPVYELLQYTNGVVAMPFNPNNKARPKQNARFKLFHDTLASAITAGDWEDVDELHDQLKNIAADNPSHITEYLGYNPYMALFEDDADGNMAFNLCEAVRVMTCHDWGCDKQSMLDELQQFIYTGVSDRAWTDMVIDHIDVNPPTVHIVPTNAIESIVAELQNEGYTVQEA